MDNSMENMLDMYLFETNSLLEQLDEILLNSEKNQTFTEDDVNEIFRIMHTIKGSSAMMQFSSLMTIAHRIEDLFYFIRENSMDAIDISYRPALFDLMFRSNDSLKAEVEKVENNEPLTDDVDPFVKEVNTFIEKIRTAPEKVTDECKDDSTAKNTAISETSAVADSSNLISSNPSLNSNPNNSGSYSIRIYFDEGCGMENLRAFMLITSIKEVCGPIYYYPDDVETNSASSAIIIDKGFIITFETKEDMEKSIGIVKDSINIQTYEYLDNHPHNVQTIEEKEPDSTVTTAKSITAPVVAKADAKQKAAPPVHNTPNKQSLISVNLNKLDSLMAIVGEIVITESMVTSSPEIQGIKLDNFTKSARQLRKLTDELQDIAMSIRMVPVSGVFQKMNRIVRDMSQQLNKNVRLTLVGEDTEVDKTIVDSIGDPIMHIVRNAMDHGIEENVKDRIALGKDPQGEITITAKHTGSEVIISVKDDGQGVELSRILNKAKDVGVLTKPETEYSKKEILALLMAPGFSTNEEVTEFSGRGVGMDVVKKNVEKVGGVVSISSEIGEGTCITLKIPLTLAIVDGMEIAVGKSIFTIPITNIRQSFKIAQNDIIHDTNGDEIVKRMDNFYPVIRIHELYNIETEITNVEDGILIWVEAGDKSYCLFVDELLGEQQVVVKPLPVYLNNFNIKNSGIAGCTILGDGNISIILDITNLFSVSHEF